MNAIEKLKAEARGKRDQAIRLAKLDYQLTMKSIREAEKLLKKRPRRSLRRCFKPPTPDNGELAGYTAIAAAEVVLAELGPLSLYEIAAEIQGRGCRAEDDPRRLVENLRASFRYHGERFGRGEDGRWCLV